MTAEQMPYDERDDESGQFSPTYTDDDFLDAVRDASPATTSNVAEVVGCKYRTAHKRLSDLDDEGRVGREEVGNSFLWRVLDE